MGYDGLPIEGNDFMFSCPPGLVLIGPNLAVCTESGQWEPDPSRLMCNFKRLTKEEMCIYLVDVPSTGRKTSLNLCNSSSISMTNAITLNLCNDHDHD